MFLPQKAFGSAIVVASDLRNPSMCAHSRVRVSQLSSLGFSSGRVEVYLPSRPLPANPARFSTVLSTRTIAMDAADLIPQSPSPQLVPMTKVEKKNNAILAVGLTAVDSDGHAITDCHNLQVDIKPIDSEMVKVLPGRFDYNKTPFLFL